MDRTLRRSNKSQTFMFHSVIGSISAQTLLSENGGVVDGPTTDLQEHHLMSSGYQLLLQILNTTFSWWGKLEKRASGRTSAFLWLLFSYSYIIWICVIRSGFSQPGHRSLLKVALGELAGRLKEGSAELTLDQLVKWEIYCLFFFLFLDFSLL